MGRIDLVGGSHDVHGTQKVFGIATTDQDRALAFHIGKLGNAPPSFAAELKAICRVQVCSEISAVKEATFVLAFVVKKAELARVAASIVSEASGDALLWFAYPKGTSKKYASDLNRDTGWDMRQSGFDTVRQVAIDADWSALRFRRLEFINHRAGTP